MNHELQAQRAATCNCTDCPGAGCTCGCRAHVAAPAACSCGVDCRCDAGDQGCVCR